MGKEIVEQELSCRITGCVYEVHSVLGYGFLEKLYEKALRIEFLNAGISVREQVSFLVNYKGKIIGKYFADLVVEGRILVEVKAHERDALIFEAQILNYLRVSGLRLGLLINFGKNRPEIKRYVL